MVVCGRVSAAGEVVAVTALDAVFVVGLVLCFAVGFIGGQQR